MFSAGPAPDVLRDTQSKRGSFMAVQGLPGFLGPQINVKNEIENILGDDGNYHTILTLFTKTDELVKMYEETKIISKADISVMIHTLTLFGYEEYIHKFIKAVLVNKMAKIPDFSYFVQIFPGISDSVKEQVIIVLALNQYDQIDEMYGTKHLLRKGMVRSALAAYGYPEWEDKENFEIPPDGRNPIPIDVHRFRLPVRLHLPSDIFANYLGYLRRWLMPKDDEV